MDYEHTPVGGREDELDLIACCLAGYAPIDVDIQPEHFDEPKHIATWQAIVAVSDAGNRPDPVSVRLALGTDGDKAAVWLSEVFQRPVVPSNAPALADRIRNAAHLRDLADMGRGLINEATLPGADPALIAERYRARMDKPVGRIKATESLAEVLPQVIDQLDKGVPAGLSTPWPDLDRLIHGLAPDRLYVVAARPGVGKTLIGQNLAMHWAQKHRLPVFFASLEMANTELGTRVLAQASHVDMSAMQEATLSEVQWQALNKALPAAMAAPVHICGDGMQTVDSIRANAREIQRRYGLGLVVVDYLQIVTPRNERLTREQQVADTSRRLKLLAKELHVPVVAMVQVKRPPTAEGEKGPRRPSMNDLRESGAIEQDADAVLILHIPDEKNAKHVGELYVAKARAGERGVVHLAMRTKWASIDSAPRPQNYHEQEQAWPA